MKLIKEPIFNIGDTVHFMHMNKPSNSKVLVVRIEISHWEAKEYKVEYEKGGYLNDKETFFLAEDKLFSSVAELKESLFNDTV